MISPSVGAGNVLRDMIESGGPGGASYRIFRQAQGSRIIERP
ncbi:MAG: hypothetical protein ACLUV8_15190 [Clostridium sp.]